MLRWVKSIDMFAIDRGKETCQYKTEFCKSNCYNLKFYRLNGRGMKHSDAENNIYWDTVTGLELNTQLKRKKNQTKRIRLCTRGEPFSFEKDISIIKDWCQANPNVDFEAPTRAWRSPIMRPLIESSLFGISNLFIHASLDPSNTQKEFDSLVKSGWSTSFFGRDDVYPFNGVSPIKCPLKWYHQSSCSTCQLACFNHNQTHHWLKRH